MRSIITTSFGALALAIGTTTTAHSRGLLEHALVLVCSDGCSQSSKVAVPKVQASRAFGRQARKLRLVINGKHYPVTCRVGRCVTRLPLPRGHAGVGKFGKRGQKVQVALLLPAINAAREAARPKQQRKVTSHFGMPVPPGSKRAINGNSPGKSKRKRVSRHFDRVITKHARSTVRTRKVIRSRMMMRSPFRKNVLKQRRATLTKRNAMN